MTVSNDKVVAAFYAGKFAVSHGNNYTTTDGVLQSYEIPVAQLLSDQSVLIRTHEECPTATTAAHANKVFHEALRRGTAHRARGARVYWDELEKWGLEPSQFTSAYETRDMGIVLCTDAGYALYHPSLDNFPAVYPMFGYTKPGRQRAPTRLGVWFKVDRPPVNALHFVRSILDQPTWEKCLESDVLWVGSEFFQRTHYTNNLTSADEIRLRLNARHTLSFRQKGDVVSAPFRLERRRTATSKIFTSNEVPYVNARASFRRLPTLCEPVQEHLSVAEQPTIQLMEWP